MEADSTSDKTLKESSEMADQGVPEPSQVNASEDRTRPEVQSEELQESYGESSESCSIKSGLQTDINSSIECSQLCGKDSARDSHCSSPTTQPVNNTDTASGHISCYEDTGNTADKAVAAFKKNDSDSSHCLHNDNIGCSPVISDSTDASVSQPSIRTAMEGYKTPHSSSDSSICLSENYRCSPILTGSNEIAVTDPSTGTGCKEDVTDKVTSCDSKTDMKPDADADQHSSVVEKRNVEEEDLYSEIIATTTKVKILKKYFGDSRRPGICHRPHHKRYYGSFKCRECYLSFNYLPSLLFHRNTHGKKYHVYECSKCSYKSSIPGAFTQHELIRHPDQLYQCHTCNLTFLQKSTLNRHQAVKHRQQQSLSFMCNLCNVTFCSKFTMINHLKLRHKIDNFGDSNNKCTDTSGSKSSQKTSADTKQMYYLVIPNSKRPSSKQCRGNAEVKCKQCKQIFPRKGMYFIQHRQSVDKSVAWAKTSCQWCTFIGVSPCQLAHHKRKAHFCCLVCNHKHANKELLKQHRRCFHRGFMKKDGLVKRSESQSHSESQWKDQPHLSLYNRYQCPTCKINCTSDKHLLHHMKDVHHQDEIQQPVTTSTEAVQHWYCMTCNVIFPTKRLLDLHIKLNHRPMKTVDSRQEQSDEQPDDDREWRCLLCNTLHQTLQECDKHQILHHPDEYEYCSRTEIAEPTLPLVMSALSQTGPPYTCNMCDCKITSIDSLHKHKEQFHKVAYSIAITDELHSKKRVYRCRYRCGFTDSIYKNVIKHEPSCKQKTSHKPSVLSQPPIVLDPYSGKMVDNYTTVSNSGASQKQSSEQNEAESSQSKELADVKEAQKPVINTDVNMTASDVGIDPDINMTASADMSQDVNPPVNDSQPEVINSVFSIQQPTQPKPHQLIQSGSTPVLTFQQLTQPKPQLKPIRPKPHALTQATGGGKNMHSSCEGYQQSRKLPVYDKHDVITSSSDDDSDCSWLDKSSDSEDVPSPGSVGMDSISSDEENVQDSISSDEENVQGASASAPQNQTTDQLIQLKPPASPPKGCPPLLQPTVLMRFFQAIDMSDLYRLALQMITGSPQPHTLPMSDPAMTTSKTARFKYKIPLGYSHKEFQHMPLFPSSREVTKLDYMQTLPSSLISKHYKSVLAKPFRSYLPTLVDSAMITHFKEHTLKGIERFVRKQRVDDRKDITLSLSQYIVSQYFKNQQKKSPSKQFQSSFGVDLTTTGNSPGAGPSGTQTQPPPIRLLISPSALHGTATPVATVKYATTLAPTTNASGPHTQSNAQFSPKILLTSKLMNVSTQNVCLNKNTEVPTTAVNTSIAGPETSSEMASSLQKSPESKEEDATKITPDSEAKKSPGLIKVAKKKSEAYSVPVRRSARLLRSPEQQSVAAGSANGFTVSAASNLPTVEGKHASIHVHDQQNSRQRLEGKSSVASESDCESIETNHEVNDQDKSKQRRKTARKCKDSQSHNTDYNRSGHNTPKSKPQSPQSWSTGRVAVSRSKSSRINRTQQVRTSEDVDDKHNQTLHMVQEARPSEIYIDAKLHHDSLLTDTVERDGVIETRMTRRPLHGLNGSTMQRPIATNTGAYHITRQAAPPNGKAYLTQAVSANLAKLTIPNGSKLVHVADLTLKPCEVKEKPCSITTPGLEPVNDPKQQPDDEIKNDRHTTPECDDVITNGLTYSDNSSLLCKGQLPPICNLSVPNGGQNISIGQTWKKTVTKYEVLAFMAKRSTWRCVPYKTGPNININQEDPSTRVETEDWRGIDGVHESTDDPDTKERDQSSPNSKFHSKQVDLQVERMSHQGSESIDSSNESNDIGNSMTATVNLSENYESKSVWETPIDPHGGPQKTSCVMNNDCTEEVTLHQGQDGCLDDTHSSEEQVELGESETTSTPGQTNPTSTASATEVDVEPKTTVLQAATSSEEEMSSNNCNTQDISDSTRKCKEGSQISVSDTAEETNITRRSLRNKDLKRPRRDVPTENRKKKQKTTVDHSYIKTPRCNTNSKVTKTRLGYQGSGKPKGTKSDAGSKADGDRLIVPHDHSYTGSRQQRSSPRIKNTDKMDHCYYWKTSDGMRTTLPGSGGYRPDPEQSSTTAEDSRHTKDNDSRGSAEDHSRCHDHCYSTTFPKQVQDQIAAMDHCYVKLTPINFAHKRQQDHDTAELSQMDENSATERKRKRFCPPTSDMRDQEKSSKHKPDQSSADDAERDASMSRKLRPRSMDSSHTNSK